MRIEEADADGGDSFNSLYSTRSQIIKTTRQTLNIIDKEDRKDVSEQHSMLKYRKMNHLIHSTEQTTTSRAIEVRACY